MPDWGGARSPRWRVYLLDGQDQRLQLLDGVTGGSVEVSATTRLGGSGSLSLDDRGQDVDWLKHRVQITYDPGIVGVEAWAVATMLLTSPRTTFMDGRRQFEVDLLSKMAVLDEDTTLDRYSLAPGKNIVQAVVELIKSTGETRIAVTESGATLSQAMTWDAGTPKLTIINDLLEAAGYWGLWCDGSGQYRIEPYRSPVQRPVSWEFQAGEAAIHKTGWQREQDLSTVPNRFVVVGQGSDESPAPVGVAENTNPESPYSYQARGRWITRTETGAEGTQQVLTQLAERRLLAAMSPVAKLTVEHAIVPLEPAARVRFIGDGYATDATIQKMSYQIAFDSQCSAEWREIQ